MKAQIVGWAHTKFGRLDAPDTRALMAEVIAPALDHAGIGTDDRRGHNRVCVTFELALFAEDS